MAITSAGAGCAANSSTAGTTITITNTNATAIAAGTFVHITGTWDNTTSTTAPVITCSTVGGGTAIANHVTPVGSGVTTSAGSGVWHQCWCVLTTSSIAPGADVATLTSNQSAAKRAVLASLFSGASTTLRIPTVTATGTTGTATAVGGTNVVGDLVIGSTSTEAASGGNSDTDTLGGPWVSNAVPVSFTTGGGAASNVMTGVQYKVTTATAAQSFTAGTFTSDTIACIYSVTPAGPVAAVTQSAYGFYADGTETGAVALAAQNTAPTIDVGSGDVNLALRVKLQETGGGVLPASDDWQLQYDKSSGDQYAFSNYDSATELSSGQPQVAQSFTGVSGPLTSAIFYLYKSNIPTGTVSAALWAHDGGVFGSTGKPTGTPLATSTTSIAVATIVAGTPTPYTFTFDGTVTLTPGTQYFIGLVTTGAAASPNAISCARDGSSPTHPGNPAVTTGGSTWVNFAADMIFEVGTWTDVTYVSTGVTAFDSPNLTDGAATTNRLTGGTGTFVSGKVSEDGLVNALGWAASGNTELLYALTLKQANLSNADALRFRVMRNSSTTSMTYTQTPTINVTKTIGGPVTQQATVALTATSTLTTTGTTVSAKPKIETLVDTFDTTVDKAVKWIASSTQTVWDASGQAKIPSNTAYYALGTPIAGSYDLTGSSVYIKFTPPTGGNGTRESFLGILRGGVTNDKLEMYVSGATFACRKTVAGTNTNVASTTYNATTHAWWRIRESGGTIFFDYSANGLAWSNLGSTTVTWNYSNVCLSINTGYYGTETAADAYVDNVNAPPAGGVTQQATAALTATSTLSTTGTAFHVLASSAALTATSTLTATGTAAPPGGGSAIVYGSSFEGASGSTDGWVSTNAAEVVASATTATPGPQEGTYYLQNTRQVITSTTAHVQKTLTGLTVGHRYTFDGWAIRTNTTATSAFTAGVVGIGSTGNLTPAASVWGSFSYPFTATATTHVLDFGATISGAVTRFVGLDNVTVTDLDYVPAGTTQQATAALTATSTLTTTAKAASPTPSISTITTDFTNPMWILDGSAQGSTTKLTIPLGGDQDSKATAYQKYSIVGQRLFWRLSQTGSSAVDQQIYSDNGTMYQYVWQDNVVVQHGPTWNELIWFDWDAGLPFLSIRELGGTIYYERSATGLPGSWQLIASAPNLDVDGLSFVIDAGSAGSGTVVVENVNSTTVTQQATAALTATSTLSTTGTAFHVLSATAALTAVSTLGTAAVRQPVASAALTATSTLTATATAFHVLAASTALSASSTLSVGAVRQPEAAASLAAVSTLTVSGVRAPQASAALAATSTLTASADRVPQAAASLVAASSLTATADRAAQVTAALSATSTLAATATGIGVILGAADLTAVSTLSVTAVRAPQATAVLTASSTLAVSAVRQPVADAALTAASQLTSVAVRQPEATAVLTAASTLSTTGIRAPQAAATLTATSTLTTLAVREQPATTALAATSTLTAAADRVPQAAVSLTAASTLAATADRTATVAVTFTATSTLTATALGIGVLLGSAPLTAVSTLSATSVRTAQLTASLVTTSTLSTTGTRQPEAAAALAASSTLTSSASRTADVAAALTATSTLTATATGIGVAIGAASLTATSTLTATAIRQPLGAASLTAGSTLTATVDRTVPATIALTAVSILSAAAERQSQGAVSLVATSTLIASAVRGQQATAGLSTTATLAVSAAGFGVATGAAGLTAGSTLTATATAVHVVAAAVPLTTSSTLTAAADRFPQGAASMVARSTLTTVAIRDRQASATLTATSTLTTAAVGIGIATATAALTATSTLGAGGVIPQPAAAPLSAQSTLTASPSQTHRVVITLASASTLSAGGERKRVVAGALTAKSTLTVVGVRELQAMATLAATSTLTTRVTQLQLSATVRNVSLTGVLHMQAAPGDWQPVQAIP